jgi:hypothetical protein
MRKSYPVPLTRQQTARLAWPLVSFVVPTSRPWLSKKNAMTEKALPAEVYDLRSAQEVANLLQEGGFASRVASAKESGLWIAEGTRA